MSLPTVASLCASLGQHLQPAEGFSAPRTPVTAVHISELLDPGAYISGGELLLTTGLALPTNRIGCQGYVARLVEHEVVALGFGLGPVHREVPEALRQACRTHDLPLLVVPAPTPFMTITKAYWAARARSTEQSLQDAVATHRALIDAAVAPDPPAEILRRLSRALEGWAAHITRTGEVDQIHPAGLIDEAQGLQDEVARLQVAGVHSAASFASNDRYVALYPMAVEGRVVGYLAVGTPAQLTASQRNIVLTAVALLSIDALRRQRSVSARQAEGRCVVTLLDLGLVDAARQLAAAVGLPALGPRGRILMLRGEDGAGLAAVVEAWCPQAYEGRTTRQETWFLLPLDHPPLRALADAVAVRDPGASASVTAGTKWEDIGTARARLATTVADLKPGQLNLVDDHPRDDEALAQRLDRFLDEQSEATVAALVGYLRHRGQWEQTARSLEIHRNTLRYRITRAREALDLDIDDPDNAARLWLMLRARGIA